MTTAKKIAIADDDRLVRDLVARTIGDDAGYVLLHAADGQAALALVRQEKPDLLFLDVTMPKMDGIDVCRTLKADPATAPTRIIMLSGRNGDADRMAALAAGAELFFTKPFSPRAILTKVEEIFALV